MRTADETAPAVRAPRACRRLRGGRLTGARDPEPELVSFARVDRDQVRNRPLGELVEVAGTGPGRQRLEGVSAGCQETRAPALVTRDGSWRLEYLPGTRSDKQCLVAEFYLVVYDVPAETVTPQ